MWKRTDRRVILIAGALAVPVLRGTARQAYMFCLALLGLVQLVLLPEGFGLQIEFLSQLTHGCRVVGLTRVNVTGR